MIMKFKMSAAAILAVTVMSVGPTAADAEKIYVGDPARTAMGNGDGDPAWGAQIHRRGWDTENNFPIEHPKKELNVHRVPAAAAFAGMNFGQRIAIQKRLRAYGLYHDRIDGKWGPNTWFAVRAYAKEAGVYNKLQTRRGAYFVFRGIAR
ncbi:MAG: peptidoglycan-binding domain-containing protein [Roseibium sp.]|uniref:peptidoglycan-binding domain-containing protein n=1 Tax=Roseibium sp. TaxID=1936156 RepID=UPI003299D960